MERLGDHGQLYGYRDRSGDGGDSFDTPAATNGASIELDRGTPYGWYVTSSAEGTDVTARSDTWRFYNEGPGIENYAPFPAEVVAPERGAALAADTASVELQWTAGDVDGDLLDYEVFLGPEGETPTPQGKQTTTALEVSVESGNTYQWTVVVSDTQGNTSTSEVFWFKVL